MQAILRNRPDFWPISGGEGHRTAQHAAVSTGSSWEERAGAPVTRTAHTVDDSLSPGTEATSPHVYTNPHTTSWQMPGSLREWQVQQRERKKRLSGPRVSLGMGQHTHTQTTPKGHTLKYPHGDRVFMFLSPIGCGKKGRPRWPPHCYCLQAGNRRVGSIMLPARHSYPLLLWRLKRSHAHVQTCRLPPPWPTPGPR